MQFNERTSRSYHRDAGLSSPGISFALPITQFIVTVYAIPTNGLRSCDHVTHRVTRTEGSNPNLSTGGIHDQFPSHCLRGKECEDMSDRWRGSLRFPHSSILSVLQYMAAGTTSRSGRLILLLISYSSVLLSSILTRSKWRTASEHGRD